MSNIFVYLQLVCLLRLLTYHSRQWICENLIIFDRRISLKCLFKEKWKNHKNRNMLHIFIYVFRPLAVDLICVLGAGLNLYFSVCKFLGGTQFSIRKQSGKLISGL